jgi:hypothetical protein
MRQGGRRRGVTELLLTEHWQAASLAMAMANTFPDNAGIREQSQTILDIYFDRIEAERSRQETKR